MEEQYRLTTFDNPYNPFVDFAEWYMFDCANEHNTCSRLARIMNTDNEMTEKEVNAERERAINLMLKYDFEGEFFKGTKDEIDKWLKTRENNHKVDAKINENEGTQTATAGNA